MIPKVHKSLSYEWVWNGGQRQITLVNCHSVVWTQRQIYETNVFPFPCIPSVVVVGELRSITIRLLNLLERTFSMWSRGKRIQKRKLMLLFSIRFILSFCFVLPPFFFCFLFLLLVVFSFSLFLFFSWNKIHFGDFNNCVFVLVIPATLIPPSPLSPTSATPPPPPHPLRLLLSQFGFIQLV